MDVISEFVLDAVGSPWLFPVVFVLTLLDAFLVIVPSETVIVALGALSLSTGDPNLAILVPVAAVAATAGDSLSYAVGRRVTLTRFAWMRRPRVVGVFAWAARALDRRAATVLLTARFVPFGRIAVNLTAGASGFAYPRFLALTTIAGLAWAVYNSVVGAIFGTLFGDNPVLAVVVSVIVAVGLGVIVDAISSRLAARRSR